MRYNNYHKHDHYSNIHTPDVIVKPEDYIKRAIELGHTTYFTTNHGCSSNVLEAYGLCQQYGLKLIHGVEMYYVDNRLHKKTRNNYHIVVIGLTKNAYRHINRVLSVANKTGFYYHPRVDMELLLSLPSEEVIVTTACIAGRLFKTEDYIDVFVRPLQEYFGRHFMLEVQDHIHDKQIEWNKRVIELSNQYDIPIIHGCDSHYIHPEDAEYRTLFLKGKGMNYGDEDSFILDYPDYNTIVARYREQGILNNEQIVQALENTLIFDKAEDLEFKNDMKMPTIYPNRDTKAIFRDLIKNKWHIEKQHIDEQLHSKYEKEIYFETDIVETTNTMDYFLLNEKIVDRAINKYGGVLTRTGRGSAPSFYINKLLGFTDIDRIDAKVPLYATRFMTVARVLDAGQMPDIDMNWASVEPVIKASKDILGEDGVYYMVAYGTMQESAAFRNLCRAYKSDMEFNKDKDSNGKILNNEKNKQIDKEIKLFNYEYNEVAKELDKYRDNHKWKDIIQKSSRFIGVIDSISPSPCSFLLLNQPISNEIGLIRVGDEVCAYIDGGTADRWGYLKNDYLTVSVWDIISKTYELIGMPIPTIKELDELLDDATWQLYADGITTTLNQVDSDFATNLVKKYKPKSVAELSAFVAAIRPGFASLLDHFLNREKYTTHVAELDEILQDSFHYLLYQESIMKMLMWCGIPEDQTYDVIKKIARKKFKEEELIEFKAVLIDGFVKQTGSAQGFDEIWQVVEDAVRYSFNASHSYSMAYDSLYCAYLKAHYPLAYYKIVLDHYKDDIERTTKLINELSYFNIELKPIKFRYSSAGHTIDKATNTIYKGISSIKYLSTQLGDELWQLRDNHYPTFTDLLHDIKAKTSCNTRQLEILIRLDFFSEFGEANQLLKTAELYEWANRKQISKNTIDKTPFTMEQLEKYSATQTEKMFKDIDFRSMIDEIVSTIEPEPMPIQEKAQYQQDYLGYIDLQLGVDGRNCYVTNVDTKYTPRIDVISLNKGKQLTFKINKKYYSLINIKKGDLIFIHDVNKRNKYMPDGKHKNGKMKFKKLDNEFDYYITNCEKIHEEQLYQDRSEESHAG